MTDLRERIALAISRVKASKAADEVLAEIRSDGSRIAPPDIVHAIHVITNNIIDNDLYWEEDLVLSWLNGEYP